MRIEEKIDKYLNENKTAKTGFKKYDDYIEKIESKYNKVYVEQNPIMKLESIDPLVVKIKGQKSMGKITQAKILDVLTTEDKKNVLAITFKIGDTVTVYTAPIGKKIPYPKK